MPIPGTDLYNAIESWRQTIDPRRDPGRRVVAFNYAIDRRVPETRGRSLNIEFIDWQAKSPGEPVEDFLKSKHDELVSPKPISISEFQTPANESNRLAAAGSRDGLAAGIYLMRIIPATKLYWLTSQVLLAIHTIGSKANREARKPRWAAVHELENTYHFASPSKFSDERAWNRSLCEEFAKHQGASHSKDFRDFQKSLGPLLAAMAFRSEVMGKPYEPAWATVWKPHAFSSQRPEDWLDSVGVPYNRDCACFMLVYPISAVGDLYRPTQLEAGPGWSVHFPSPVSAPLAGGGHPMHLGGNWGLDLKPEFVHAQIIHDSQHVHAVGVTAAERKMSTFDHLQAPRVNHWQALRNGYPDPMVPDWIGAPGNC